MSSWHPHMLQCRRTPDILLSRLLQCQILQPRATTGGAALQVDASAIRDLQDASQIEGYALPKLYRSAGKGAAFVQNAHHVCSAHFRAGAPGLSGDIMHVQRTLAACLRGMNLQAVEAQLDSSWTPGQCMFGVELWPHRVSLQNPALSGTPAQLWAAAAPGCSELVACCQGGSACC